MPLVPALFVGLFSLCIGSFLNVLISRLPDPTRTQDPVRADMVFTATGHGGAVFAVGSIAWAGSLSHNNYVNSVSAITKNVLDRFVSPEPIPTPATA